METSILTPISYFLLMTFSKAIFAQWLLNILVSGLYILKYKERVFAYLDYIHQYSH